jgi:hypothetical protein
MATADRLERQIQAAKAAPKTSPVPRPVTAAVKPVAAAPKPTAPVVSRPQVAPTVATPKRTALATMGGSADARERQIEAAKGKTTQAVASNKINSQVQSSLAMQGSKSSAGARAGGTADRMSRINTSAIYGVPEAQGQKIDNTYVDVQRAVQGQAPVFSPNQKVSKLPNALVASSAKGSLASGWQNTGPVSSRTGNYLMPGLPNLDASQDLRTPPGGGGGGNNDEEVPFFEEEFYPEQKDKTLSRVDQEALAAMINESGGPMNLLEPVSGSERRVTQVDAPERVVRNLTFQPTYGPMLRRNRFLRGM